MPLSAAGCGRKWNSSPMTWAAQAEPSDAELNHYLQAHPDAFRAEPRFSFRSVSQSTEGVARICSAMRAIAGQLNASGAKVAPAQLGDALMLEPAYAALPLGEVANSSGAVRGAASGTGAQTVAGPVESGTVCIWCTSANARPAACPSWRRCARPYDASGPCPAAGSE